MREETFWQIVEICRSEAGPDTEHVARLLLRRLRALGENEILEFEELWFRAQDEWRPCCSALSTMTPSFRFRTGSCRTDDRSCAE
ncbi:DUF4240 domain-containing protein [Herbidospora cretacea]|uniref:DUF4240 domain-containing protein n=1 Tax=Herbidospora cretacea TaxID=28444 RepID=UPI0018CC7864